MSVRVNHFESLRQRYPTFDELRAYLESAEGGSLRWIDAGDCGIFRYKTDKTADVFRSVVWNKELNVPLCVAPFRAKEGLPPIGTQLSATEDFADGFMMNAWVGSDGILKLATRTRIGADNSFYSEKTFGEMFGECIANTGLKTLDTLRKELEQLREENTAAFVSFVIHHPDHRVVAKTVHAGLNVIHTGLVSKTGFVSISERATNWPQSFARLQVPSYPTRIFHSEQEVQDFLRHTSVQKGWRWQGLVFKDGQGGRWRLRTPTYTMMRELRGAEATNMERFFRLRTDKKVVEYLKHYSEDRDEFWKYEQTLRARTNDILLAYADVHKGHSIAFKDLPEAYKPGVFTLHVKWLEELRPKGFKVRLQNAIEVVNGLRDFEKRRLMEAAEYVPVMPGLIPISEAVSEAVSEASPPTETA